MSTIYYDADRLHQAVVLLFSKRFGAERSKILREKILELPRHPAKYLRQIEPLNEILVVAKQDKIKALDLLDLVDKRREQMIAAAEKAAPELTEKRARWAESMRKYRERLALAVRIREIELGRPLSSKESQEYKKALADAWTSRRREYCKESGLQTWKANAEFTEILEREIDDAYQNAMRKAEVRKLKDKFESRPRKGIV